MNPPGMPPLPAGTRIGGDVVEEVLGSGGFATVCRVRSPEGRLSALKLLPLDEGTDRTARAQRELSLGTRLRHANLACQVGAGQWPEDKPRFLWLKLELIEGPTLEKWGRAPGRTVGEVVERVQEVARALAVMHEARVVHRDVKEANILVRESNGQAVLVDFGVGYHTGDPTLTKGMFPPGTLPFRPAEHGGVDVEAVLHQMPLPPHLLNPSVPRKVEAVCLRLLAKTPPGRVVLRARQ